jgi:hypothetical protein
MSLAVEPPAKAERMDRRSGRELANPPAISRSGAAACSTLLQLRQAYFGRVMRYHTKLRRHPVQHLADASADGMERTVTGPAGAPQICKA